LAIIPYQGKTLYRLSPWDSVGISFLHDSYGVVRFSNQMMCKPLSQVGQRLDLFCSKKIPHLGQTSTFETSFTLFGMFPAAVIGTFVGTSVGLVNMVINSFTRNPIKANESSLTQFFSTLNLTGAPNQTGEDGMRKQQQFQKFVRRVLVHYKPSLNQSDSSKKILASFKLISMDHSQATMEDFEFAYKALQRYLCDPKNLGKKLYNLMISQMNTSLD
jgi:hypothetical protein